MLVPTWHTIEGIAAQYETMTLKSFIRYTLNQFPPDDISNDAAFNAAEMRKVVVSSEQWDWSGTLALGIDGAMSGDSFALVFSRFADKRVAEIYPIIFEKLRGDSSKYDLAYIEELLVEYCAKHNVARIGLDPSRLLLLAQHLKDRYGLDPESFAQDNPHMCAASAHMHGLVHDSRLVIYGPDAKKMIAHMKNTTKLEREPWGWRFGKNDASDCMDGVIAGSISLIMLDASADDGPSFAERGGLYELNV
jgi:hypothetical protein